MKFKIIKELIQLERVRIYTELRDVKTLTSLHLADYEEFGGADDHLAVVGGNKKIASLRKERKQLERQDVGVITRLIGEYLNKKLWRIDDLAGIISRGAQDVINRHDHASIGKEAVIASINWDIERVADTQEILKQLRNLLFEWEELK